MKLFKVFLTVFLLAFVFVVPAFAQGTGTEPASFHIPVEFVVLMSGFLGYAVTQGFKAAGLPIDGTPAKIAAALTTGLILFSEAIIGALVPVPYQPAVTGLFMLAVTILTAMGIHYAVKSFQKKPPLPAI